jgi:hypothetical protein
MPLLCGFVTTFCATTLPLSAQAQDDNAATTQAPAAAQAPADATTGATAGATAGATSEGGALPELAAANSEGRVRQATTLVERAMTIAENNAGARLALARGAGAILPRLDAAGREPLTLRWIRILESPNTANVVPRAVRLDAYSSFFDVASRADTEFARRIALLLPDAAARAGALIDISEATERGNYPAAVEAVHMAQQAARREPALRERARALTYVAYRMVNLDDLGSDAAIVEASSQARLLPSPRARDYLLADVAGAASRNDLRLARRIADSISDPDLKNLANARISISEVSQSTFVGPEAARVTALAKAASRYDTRAIPILMQMPATPDVLKALSDALPVIYPTARPAIDSTLLERMWRYSLRASEASPQRDELQSRLARVMVMHDLWRGRDWGKQLAWKGGRVQVGAFIRDVLESRRSQVRAMPLHEVAKRNVNAAITQANALPPAGRVEALLLIAGQLLG